VKVEAVVGLMTRWILASLRHQQFFSLFALNLAIRRLPDELNDRIVQTPARNALRIVRGTR